MQRLSHLRKGHQDGPVLGDKRHAQLLGSGDELTVVGTSGASAHRFVGSSKELFRFIHQRNGLRKEKAITPQVAGDDIAKLASPERWGCSLGVLIQKCLRQVCLRSGEQQIGQHVGVYNDQGRPSRLNASISSG
jgi:hypothetical protein